MTMTFDVMWQRVRDLAEAELGHAVDDEYVGAFCRASLKVLDLQVANNGEIIDPRPAPARPVGPNRGWTPPTDNSRRIGRRRK